MLRRASDDWASSCIGARSSLRSSGWRRLGAAAQRHLMAQRIKLTVAAADHHVGRKSVAYGSNFKPLSGTDRQPWLTAGAAPALRAAVLTAPWSRPVAANVVNWNLLRGAHRQARLFEPPARCAALREASLPAAASKSG